MAKWQYTKGLHDLGRGCFAYLQPDGSWGWSNAGLITSGDQTLLVDTLFDLPLTAEMLATMRDAVPAARRIEKLVNTHANGDHTFGNQLVEGADIIACRACADEYAEWSPSHFLKIAADWKNSGDGGAFFYEAMGSKFDWRGLVDTPPTTVFDQTMELTVGDKKLVLTHLGPAHTRGDVLVHVPADRILYRRSFVRRRPPGYLGRADRQLDKDLRLHPGPRCGRHRSRPWTDFGETRRGRFKILFRIYRRGGAPAF
jgi:glyoxylase-like metal-dependent hydrolase (beta-lactamase superfamily II)